MIPCTVAIPVYNRRELTRRAIDSALAQDVEGLEVLAVDDCSADDVWELLRSYTDPRFVAVRNPVNLGLFQNFNRCLQLARGEYVRLLCCDDLLPPGCLAREIPLLAAHPRVGLVTTRYQRVSENGEPLGIFADGLAPGLYSGHQAIAAVLWARAHYGYNPFNYPSGILLRRQAALDSGGFDTQFRVAGDVDLFLKILEKWELAVTPDVGCVVTAHAGQVSSRLWVEGFDVREWRQLAERHREALIKAGIYRRVLDQLAGNALALGVYFYALRVPRAGRLHLHIARETGTGLLPACLGIGRLMGYRLLRCVGLRSSPHGPERPLPGSGTLP